MPRQMPQNHWSIALACCRESPALARVYSPSHLSHTTTVVFFFVVFLFRFLLWFFCVGSRLTLLCFDGGGIGTAKVFFSILTTGGHGLGCCGGRYFTGRRRFLDFRSSPRSTRKFSSGSFFLKNAPGYPTRLSSYMRVLLFSGSTYRRVTVYCHWLFVLWSILELR